MDIINVDTRIHEEFKSESVKAETYKKIIKEIEDILIENDNDKLEKSLTEYKTKLFNIESGNLYEFYLAESFPILEQYKKILKIPIKVGFFKSTKTEPNTELDNEKENLIYKFSQIVKKYSKTDFTPEIQPSQPKLACDNCNSKNISLVDDLCFVCSDCGSEKTGNTNTLSYKDINRTNVLQKYTYEKRSHFRDALNQYQGKQISKIDSELFQKLRQQFEAHNLLVRDADDTIRFKNIKKQHVFIFLKELGYDKQYENVNYIYSELTGKKCPDISHLKAQLMDDFDILVNLYTKRFKYEKNIERKSFINIQCVVFQLLLKNKHPCKQEDFNILKTTDRKAFHDEILQELFEELGWNYVPFF